MASLQTSSLRLTSSSSASSSRRSITTSSLRLPANFRLRRRAPCTITNMEELALREDSTTSLQTSCIRAQDSTNSLLASNLLSIAEAAADRAEMHAIIGEQRDNWGHHLLSSTNAMTLTASLMAGVSSIPSDDHLLALKLSSALLFAAATGIMALINKLQPSQLAEEQRNAARLFRQIERSIHASLSLRPPVESDVEEAMERVLALDKAYPLPLLPEMLEKFPENLEPTVWWPETKKKYQRRRVHEQVKISERNGWSTELEEEMKGVLTLLKEKDIEEYVDFGEKVLEINRKLAVLGPFLTGIAAVGTGFIGAPAVGPLAAVVAVAGGALATVVNTVEHGGQMGMVFELCRNCAGFYRQLEEEIEVNLGEEVLERRENGEVFERKVALVLGRSMSEMKGLAKYASGLCDGAEKFAGKLF